MNAWRKTFHLSPQFRQDLVDALGNLGWKVCNCNGEADVCIGTLAKSHLTAGQGPIAVATTDSDFLFYENLQVLRQNPKSRSQYNLFDTTNLIGELDSRRPSYGRGKKRTLYPPMTPEVWKVIGVTNTNDYHQGIKGYGLRTLWRAIGATWEDFGGHGTANDLLLSFVESLDGRVSEVPNFKDAKSVFLDLQETPTTTQRTLQGTRDSDISDLMQVYKGASALMKEAEKAEANRAQTTSSDSRHFRTSGNEFKARIVRPPRFSTSEPESSSTSTRPKRKRTDRISFVELFQKASANFDNYTNTLLSAFPVVRTFYSSNTVKRWESQRKKGGRAEEDRAIQSIIDTTLDTSHPGHPVQDGTRLLNRTPILAIGDGEFKGLHNVVDKSNGLRKRLVAKALHSGIEDDNKHLGLDAGKGMMIDRDHNASSNMSKAVIKQVTEFTWPAHLSRSNPQEQEPTL
ncbi:hypothetical protein BGZ73_007858 [Actinomortierella ambigua]|nr:hypothetical protein BGZ73_007858 [Actinomortierella ambigua]